MCSAADCYQMVERHDFTEEEGGGSFGANQRHRCCFEQSFEILYLVGICYFLEEVNRLSGWI